ncbi:histidine phosphatase family protein [Pigmentiphaga aceris]|uniref:Histidine phosphatase family protein n=1 Tax=Pigmentiphaga aceris TaxID=1940612 RepID=A0A5C0AV15_9BURK|nr:histidine phosphatase family protein [Pigmentiphaga aceris]QEI06188.1 histidine phosphatase family protein [Pigmentiphaga aceris]
MSGEIILMRHGKPALGPISKVSARDMKQWIEQYDLAGIVDESVPQASQALARRANIVVSSSAPRALASVAALGLSPSLIDAVFCEAQLPHGRWTQPRLSPFTWAFMLRMAWLGGFAPTVESARDAGLRADQAMQQLQTLAGEENVLLLGHGFMNRMIGKRLERAGWARHESSGSRYWSASTYRKPEPK